MERIFRKPKLLRTLTTLEVGEFERLLAAFDAVWQAQRRERTHDGQVRQRKLGGGFKGTLPTTRAKLFFVLFYCKCYPLQEVMAVLFGLSQGRSATGWACSRPWSTPRWGVNCSCPPGDPPTWRSCSPTCPSCACSSWTGRRDPSADPRTNSAKRMTTAARKRRTAKRICCSPATRDGSFTCLPPPLAACTTKSSPTKAS